MTTATLIVRRAGWAVAGVVSLCLLAGCSSSSSGPGDDDPPDGLEVLEEVSGTVTSTGASLTLSNGMMLEIPTGGAAAGTQVRLARLWDTTFTAAYQTLLEVQSDVALTTATLQIPIPEGQRADHYGAAKRSADGMRMIYLDGAVNGTQDTFLVSLAEEAGMAAGAFAGAAAQYVIEEDPGMPLVSASKIIEAPYYEQDGGNCWAACWLLLLRTYTNVLAYDEIYKILRISDVQKDEGVKWIMMGFMVDKTNQWTGLTTEKNTWVRYQNFVDFVIKKIDAGIPVMTNLIVHQGVFVGYEVVNPGPNQDIYLIYHDTKNQSPQVPYRRISIDDLFTQFWHQGVLHDVFNYFVTINLSTPPSTEPRLQTVHLLDGDNVSSASTDFAKGLGFDRDNKVVDLAIWDHRSPTGLSFENAAGVPRDIDRIVLRRVPVWNMDRSASASIRTRTSLYRVDRQGVYSEPPLEWREETVTIPAKSVHNYETEFAVDEFVGDLHPADSVFAVEVEIFGADGTRLDGFDVQFRYRPLHINSITPASGQPGDWVTIQGVGFGPTMTSVTFDGEAATHVSIWNDSTIVAKVPDAAGSGNVVVTAGEFSSNGVYFTISGLLDMIKRSRFESFNAFGEFHNRGSVMFGAFFPANYEGHPLEWNGRVATKNYADPSEEMIETQNLRIVFSESGLTVDSITGYLRNDMIAEGHIYQSTETQLGAVNLPFQYYMDDEDGFFCWYVIQEEDIPAKLTRFSWKRTSYDEHGAVTFVDTLTSVNWTNPDHKGEIKLLLFENSWSGVGQPPSAMRPGD